MSMEKNKFMKHMKKQEKCDPFSRAKNPINRCQIQKVTLIRRTS